MFGSFLAGVLTGAAIGAAVAACVAIAIAGLLLTGDQDENPND